MEREGVKFIHLKPILLKLISGLNGLDRLMTSNLKTGKKVSFALRLFFVFSSKQEKNLGGFRLLRAVFRNISSKHLIVLSKCRWNLTQKYYFF